MKSSLAFAGALVLVFATGAALTRFVSTDRRSTAFNPIDKRSVPAGSSSEHPELAPDTTSTGGVSGAFVPNLGQVPHDVYFQWIGPRLVAHFQADAVVLEARRGRQADLGQESVRVRFVGAGRRPQVEATQQSRGRLTYPLGGAKLYSASIPLFSELTYTGLYEGVDLRFMASESGLVRRITFAPGVAPSTLLMHFEGGGRPTMGASHNLEFEAAPLELAYPRPDAYQVVDGVRTPVSADFEIRHFGAVGISVPDFDPSLPLVVEIAGV